MKQVDEECPLDGAKAFTKSVTLPKEIPPVSLLSSETVVNARLITYDCREPIPF